MCFGPTVFLLTLIRYEISPLLSLSLCLSLSATASPEAKLAGLDEEEYEEQNNGEEEGQDIQAVVLVPGELVCLDSQVLGTFVSHGELDPEYRLVQRTHRPVMVDAGQPHGIFLVPMNINLFTKNGDRREKRLTLLGSYI